MARRNVVKTVISGRNGFIVQDKLFLFLVMRFLLEKRLRRFNTEHSLMSGMPPVDVYLEVVNSNEPVSMGRIFIEIKSGKKIEEKSDFCDAFLNFYEIEDRYGPNGLYQYQLYTTEACGGYFANLLISQGKSSRTKDQRKAIREMLASDIQDRWMNKNQSEKTRRLKARVLNRVIAKVEWMPIDFSVSYDEILKIVLPHLTKAEGAWEKLYKCVSDFIEYRNANPADDTYFDEYLFKNGKILSDKAASEFIAEYSLDTAIPASLKVSPNYKSPSNFTP